MWKFLILNTLWLAILVMVQLFGSVMDRLVVLGAVFVLAAMFASKGVMDPIAWGYYVLFSLAVFRGAGYFRGWAFDRLDHLRREVADARERFGGAVQELEQKKSETGFIEKKADEIVEFYDQVKEMSRSLSPLEAFLVFAEALSEYFSFDTVKLALFDGRHPESAHPSEVYELKGSYFKGLFDRSVYLAEPKRCRGEVYPFDQSIYRTVLTEKREIPLEESKSALHVKGPLPTGAFAAYPAMIDSRIFAVLTLVGVETNEDPLFFVLIERFLSELERVRLYESVQKLAITDGLTGVFMRHHLTERMEGEMDRSRRFGLKLSFLMIDIDFFKHFNDEYGHLVGDRVLRQVAQTIKRNIREVDFVGRYGGEEFGVGLIETDEGTAFLVAERIRRSIHDKAFKVYDESLKVNVSIGCATLSGAISNVSALVEAADEALYQAKRLGRNRVCRWGVESSKEGS